MRNKMLLCACTSLLIIGSTGCVGLLGESMLTAPEEGRLLLSTDRAGLEAFGDLITGTIAVGKASPDQDTAHHIMRKEQIRATGAKWTSLKSKREGAQSPSEDK